MELTEKQKDDIGQGKYFIVEGVGAPEVEINSAQDNLKTITTNQGVLK